MLATANTCSLKSTPRTEPERYEALSLNATLFEDRATQSSQAEHREGRDTFAQEGLFRVERAAHAAAAPVQYTDIDLGGTKVARGCRFPEGSFD